ncbi:MAG: universal stress protein [Pseudomonadota bacterium]
MHKHILVPIAPGHIADHSKSLEMARRLLAEGGKITVLSVLEELPSYISSYFPADQVEKNLSEMKEVMKSEIEKDDTDVQTASGHPTNTILDWADKNAVDCIVVSSHRPGFSHLLLGSTAARVVRHAKCTVLVVR